MRRDDTIVTHFRMEFQSSKIFFRFVIIMFATSPVSEGVATVDTSCIYTKIGQSSELVCNIQTGNVDNGINWFNSGNQKAIIDCKRSGACISKNKALYSTTNIVNNVQKITILNVSEDDLNRTWTCVDGTTPTSPGFSQCTLTQKTAETTANCTTGSLDVGKPFNLTCDIKGTVVHGIRWLRDKEVIITCSKNGECISKMADFYSTENVAGNQQQFTILGVSEDDLDKTWTCADGTPDTDNTTPGCKVKPQEVINVAIGCSLTIEAAVGCSLVAVVILVIIDIIIYIGCKDILLTVKKIYIIYCVVDVVIVGIVDGVATYYIYLRTCDIGIIAGTCICFVVLSTIIKIIIVKTKLFSKCSSSQSSNSNKFPLG